MTPQVSHKPSRHHSNDDKLTVPHLRKRRIVRSEMRDNPTKQDLLVIERALGAWGGKGWD
jgi:hypothetical protein